MGQSRPIQDVIRRRFSCRTYEKKAIEAQTRRRLEDLIGQAAMGPLGSKVRFQLIAATEQDRAALKGLGTYGFVKNPTGFFVGAVESSGKDMEDYGYLGEQLILDATALGLGTCWLGGSFARSRFAQAIDLRPEESMPAVVSIGMIADRQRAIDPLIRRGVGADKRRSWEQLFFEGTFETPLSREKAGRYAEALEMVRLGPSASNKQPWRIVRKGECWHFYLRRTPGYHKPALGRVKTADLQRVDIGIAMCHWALMAEALGLCGVWQVNDPGIGLPDALTEYAASWIPHK
ncbi:MAG: nitroreductase family protein [Anaerolineae bacterium]|nr:nitroreductase family protein [Anaerolineae bacterium]